MNDLNQTIAKRVRLARAELNISQDDLGRQAGLSQGKVSDVELGVARVSVQDLAAIASIVGHPLLWFLGEDQAQTPQRDHLPDALNELLLFVATLKAKYSRP